MKSDFLLAITQLSAEKNLPKEVVLGAVESALVSAYRKEHFLPNQNIAVRISPTTGRVEVWAEKTVSESVTDDRKEITLAQAKKVKPDANLGDILMVESTPANAGRIAAQTAKQVILQRLHEAEHSAIFEEYAGKSNDIITGVVQRIESKQVFVNLGRTEAVLPSTEQTPGERYRIGQRLRVYVVEVARTPKGPKLLPVNLYLIGSDMLCNAACFRIHHLSLTNGVQKPGFAMVYMTHYRDYRRTRYKIGPLFFFNQLFDLTGSAGRCFRFGF